MLSALASVGLLSIAHANDRQVLLAGRLDIPVLAGSSLVDGCPEASQHIDADIGCVQIQRMPSGEQVFFAYIDALAQHHWDEMHDLPGELRFDRFVGDSGCVERLTILTDYERQPQRRDFRLVFVFYRQPLCGLEREAL